MVRNPNEMLLWDNKTVRKNGEIESMENVVEKF
jgi:hypothetical protein